MLSIWSAFRALSALAQVGIVVAVIGTAWGSFALWKHSIEKGGYDRAKHEVEQDDAERVNDALRASNRRHACIASGRVWDITQGQCRER